MDNPLVSISCITFNHAPFIRQCLYGFVMQKTTFPFEVLIHDDASTDGTADIIREYEQKYPDIIKPIYQTENQYSKGISISRTYIFPRVQGKYFAICEGDDYWIDEYKLQKQVDFLEANEDFSICFHPVKAYSENEEKFIENHTVVDVPEITDIKMIAERNYINTTSVMYRVNKQVFNELNTLPILPVGDYILHMFFAKHGKIKKLKDTMAVYRLHKDGVWGSKPIEYTYPIWLKLLVVLIHHFIDNREICSILMEQYKRLNTPEHHDKIATLYFNTGEGYSQEETYSFQFLDGNNMEISCSIPENVISVRLDPTEGCGCVISNIKILSLNGVVQCEPVNGYKNTSGDIVFVNKDPQIEFRGVSNWVKIKYQILPLLEFSHYRVLTNYIETSHERDRLILERNNLILERNGLIHERHNLTLERDGMLSSRSWRITKPLRNFSAFVRRHKVLYSFAKGLLYLKRNGILKTVKKVVFNKQKQQLSIKDMLFLTKKEKLSQEKTTFRENIKISIITPLYNTPKRLLKEMIDSVKTQTYGNWELCLADGSDEEHESVKTISESYAKNDKRIKYKKLDKNLGISGNSNIAMEMTSGEYIGIFDHDDVLHPSALYEVMKAICNENADYIYTDEATFTNDNIIVNRYYKPDYAIDTLRSCNYICHFSVFSRKIMEKAGKFRSEFDGSQDHDLILRYTETASKIVHIPKLLYFWRSHENSVASDIGNKSYAITAGKNAVKEDLVRHGISAQIESTKVCQTIYRVIYDLTDRPLVSIIILNKDHVSLLRNCLSSIMEKTMYDNYEIIIVENNSLEQATFDYYEELKCYKNINILYWKVKVFNYSELNNFAVQKANGQHLVFLNNDVEIITPNWIEEMLMYSQRNDVGAVGIKLYFPDDTIQHAGVLLKPEGILGHIYHGIPRDTIGYMGKLHFVQNMSAVTAACMMIRKSVFEEVGLFLPEFHASYNDIDLCMRLRCAGYLIVWTPYAEAYHHESKTRGHPDTPEKQRVSAHEVTLFKDKWAKELAAGDPYYNPAFSVDRADYSLL